MRIGRKKSLKANLKITGITPEGKHTLSGVYKLYETFGIPLDIIVNYLFDHGYLIDLEAFRHDCENGKMNVKSIDAKIETIVEELKILIKEKAHSFLH